MSFGIDRPAVISSIQFYARLRLLSSLGFVHRGRQEGTIENWMCLMKARDEKRAARLSRRVQLAPETLDE